MDIDILPIFFYSILYKKTILFYKENQQKSNRGYYITRDTDNIRSNKKLVLYHKKQRIVNNKSKDYLIFDTNRYIDIQYNDNQFIYKKYLKGFSENNGLWIKNIDTPINRQLSYLEDYYIKNPIYINKRFSSVGVCFGSP